MRCSLFIALLCFSLAAAAPVVTNCPYDRPTAPEWEVFAFVLDNNWTALDWSCVTTVAWFGAADPAVSDVCLAHSHGARVVIHSDLNAIPGGSINNATARTAGVQALLATATRLSIDGVNLDIEGYTGSKASLTAYVQELAAAFRAALPTSQLSFDLAVLPNGQAQYYDHAALAEVLDFLVPMAYDEASPPCVPDCTVQWPLSMSSTFPDPTHWLSDHDSGLRCSLHYRQDWGSLTPEANSPLPALPESVKQYAALGVKAHKLLYALPWYGGVYPCDDPAKGASCSVSLNGRPWDEVVGRQAYNQVLAHVGVDNTTAVTLDATTTTKTFEFVTGGKRYVTYIDDAETLSAKVGTLRNATTGLRGAAMWYAEDIDGISAPQSAAMWSAFHAPFP